MSLVRLHLNRFGHLQLSFVNARLLRRVLAQVVQNGGPAHPSAYLQVDRDVQELLARLSPRQRLYLEEGFPIRVHMDGWEAAHYYGYDAHCVFEQTR